MIVDGAVLVIIVVNNSFFVLVRASI